MGRGEEARSKKRRRRAVEREGMQRSPARRSALLHPPGKTMKRLSLDRKRGQDEDAESSSARLEEDVRGLTEEGKGARQKCLGGGWKKMLGPARGSKQGQTGNRQTRPHVFVPRRRQRSSSTARPPRRNVLNTQPPTRSPSSHLDTSSNQQKDRGSVLFNHPSQPLHLL